jgi:hypothetical protein
MRALALFMLLLVRPLMADDVTDWIDEGRKAWLAGKGDEAIQHLETASQMIRQAKGERLEQALPEAPAGWTRTDAGSSALGGAYFGGMTGANASYERQQGDDLQTVSISIATDSPMMSMLLMSFANPMMLSASGQKLVKVGDQKASMEYDEADKSGTLHIVVEQKVLVTVEGSAVSADELKAFAGAVKVDVIRKVLAGQS